MTATAEAMSRRHVPPPIAFVGAFAAGWAVQRWLWPGNGAAPFVQWVGILLMAAAIGLTFSAAVLFRRHGTTLVPHGESSHLIRTGPYRVTRNPLYLSMTAFYLGASLALGAWAALVLLPLPVLYIARSIVPMEETQLERIFGDAYREYRCQVRRWL